MPTLGAIADDVAIYLHIGQMKTGTTSLQCTLARERKNLLEHGVLYPKTGALPKHSDLVWSMLPREKLSGWAAGKYNGKHTDEILADLEHEIIESKAKTVVISSEELSLCAPCLLKKLFKRWKQHLRVIVYLRRQDEMLESMYKQQLLHKKLKFKFVNFCKRKTSKNSPLGGRLDYDKFLAAWEACVGLKNMRVSLFEGAVKADLWGDFTRHMGLDIPLGSDMERENVSVSGSYLEFLRRTNCYVPQAVRRKLIRDINWLMKNTPKSTLPLCPDRLRENILARYDESNRRVAERYFGRETLFAPATPKP